MVKKVLKEYQPWNLSYKMSFEAKPSWSRHGLPHLFDEFISLIKSSGNGTNHLDIGCGDGVKTVNYALNGLNTVGIDISNDGFKEAKELIKELKIPKKCKVIKANCLKLPFETGTITSASDTLCFTHLQEKDHQKYSRELYRVLKNGSLVMMVLFSDKDKHFHGHSVSRGYSFRFDPDNPEMAGFAHYHGMYNVHFGRQEIKKTFSDTFRIVKMIEVPHPLYDYRYLWNIILQKPKKDAGQTN